MNACGILMLAAIVAVSPTPPVKKHCQIPCGIYGDKIRIDLLMEDAATIEKGMKKIGEFTKAGNFNQAVRWITNKDEHAGKIQRMVADYWLAQRIKAPKDSADAKARAKYLRQLELMHGINVAAMKCKQTTDVAHVAKLRSLAMEFARTYFKPEDLKHIEEHHGSRGR